MSSFPWQDVGSGRLVVRMPNWLGDAVFALPVLEELRRQAPGVRLELLARPAVAQVLRALDGVSDAVLEAGPGSLPGVRHEARLLRGAAAVLLLPNSFASALAAFFARVPIRVGARRDGRGWLLTHPISPPAGIHQADYYCTVSGLDLDRRAVHVRLRPEVLARAGAVSRPGSFAVLVPGAAFGSAKRWGAERYAELGRSLRGRGLELLVLGSSAEGSLCHEVAGAAGGRSLAGETDGGLFAGLIGIAALVAANDSGALHLAAALGTPALGIYGATSPAATGPLAGAPARVLYHQVACSPCGLRECNQPSHLCMEAVTPAAAATAAIGLLEPVPATASGVRP